jgi:hypothetical protein
MNYTDREDFRRKVLEQIKNEDKGFLYFIIPGKNTLKLTSYVSMQNDLFFLIGATNMYLRSIKNIQGPKIILI